MQIKLEKRLKELVAYPTESSNTAACTFALNQIEEELSDLGLFVTTEGTANPWLVATTKDTKSPKVLLYAHLDVVPASDFSQYELRAKDGKLFGRGVFDMKFSLACFLELINSVKEKYGNFDDFDFGLIVVTDEEIGGDSGVRQFVDMGFSAEVCILPDGGRDWKLERRAKGKLAGFIHADGRSTHASRPWEGENAINKLLPMLTEFNERFKVGDKTDDSLAFTQIKGGTAGNQIPDRASVEYDIRSYSRENLIHTIDLLNQAAEKYDLRHELTYYLNPVTIKKEHPRVKEFLEIYESFMGAKAEFTDSYGSSDARYFDEINVPCILLEPNGGGSHGPEEWLNQKDLLKFYKLIELYIEKEGKVDSSSH